MKIRCIALPLLLAGCVPLTPYKAPVEGPLAQIKSELSTHDSYNEWLSVRVSTDVDCLEGRQATRNKETALFSVHSTTSRPAGYVDIAANQPLHLVMGGLASADQRCTIEFVTEFAAGRRYVLKGGIVDTASAHGRLCRIDVVNADTGTSLVQFETPTQVTPAPTESYARRQFMAHQGCYVPSPNKDRQP
ncbi:hypothetical protein [Pseudomonas costantinii]|uniref:Lipoprotein n=1 Tax=Pseudomonas costantinii TaxID=168469 RepID=A0A1S2V5A8_9PSED|nr:hypothetical protein [Pseudomonas costantinii]NVZ19441.1 hypothetical protein [Pseudomonas costantinii]OIN53660.1 hypothetical protein BFL40_09270 [Pseudomonas costantinii]SEE33107.1 hypothetical protein SAMN04515675_4975 [Pseudomonas costantinii]